MYDNDRLVSKRPTTALLMDIPARSVPAPLAVNPANAQLTCICCIAEIRRLETLIIIYTHTIDIACVQLIPAQC